MCPHLTFTQNLGSSPPVSASLCFMSVSSFLSVYYWHDTSRAFVFLFAFNKAQRQSLNTLEGYLRVQCSMHAFSPMPQADSLPKPVSHPITTVHDLQHNSTELPVCLTESETRTLHFQNCRSSRDSRMRRTVCRSIDIWDVTVTSHISMVVATISHRANAALLMLTCTHPPCTDIHSLLPSIPGHN